MIITAIIFVVLGILIKYGKMYFLIAGYNTMSAKEKEKYDIEGIATIFRNVMFSMATIILIGYFIAKFIDNPAIENYSLYFAIALGIPYLLVKSNSDKYKINK